MRTGAVRSSVTTPSPVESSIRVVESGAPSLTYRYLYVKEGDSTPPIIETKWLKLESVE